MHEQASQSEERRRAEVLDGSKRLRIVLQVGRICSNLHIHRNLICYRLQNLDVEHSIPEQAKERTWRRFRGVKRTPHSNKIIATWPPTQAFARSLKTRSSTTYFRRLPRRLGREHILFDPAETHKFTGHGNMALHQTTCGLAGRPHNTKPPQNIISIFFINYHIQGLAID